MSDMLVAHDEPEWANAKDGRRAEEEKEWLGHI